MLNSRKSLKTVGIIVAILLMAAIVVDVFLLKSSKGSMAIVAAVLNLITLGFGFYYSYIGYKKEAAKYYKGFMLLYAVVLALDICSDFAQGQAAFSGYMTTILLGLSFVCVTVLAFGKDLGKNVSEMLGIFVIVFRGVTLIRSIVEYANLKNYLMSNIIGLVLALATLFFVYVKYVDKQMRGRKV